MTGFTVFCFMVIIGPVQLSNS